MLSTCGPIINLGFRFPLIVRPSTFTKSAKRHLEKVARPYNWRTRRSPSSGVWEPTVLLVLLDTIRATL
jgi:hypothetical protein